MDEDEIDAWVDCKEPNAVPASKINRADLALVLLHPLNGFLMGSVNAVNHLQGLLSLHSAALDAQRARKQFIKDAERDIERVI